MQPCNLCENRAYVSHETVTLDGAEYVVCDQCLADHDGPGKFEREASSDASLALALILHMLYLDGGADHWLANEWQGVAAQFGAYVLTEDHDGFVDVREHRDADAAERLMNELEDDGFGANEEDGWISYTSQGIEASLGGTYLGRFERETRAKAAVSVEMRKQGYYPNVFVSGEHGPSVRRVSVW